MNTPSTAILLLALATSSCIVESSSSPPRARGSLLVDWTIDGQRDPDQCDQGNAERIAIVVFRADGAELAEYQDSCRVFATQIDLPPGAYSAEAVLLDPAGVERTTAVDLQTFEIFGGDELDIPIDFPASSFR